MKRRSENLWIAGSLPNQTRTDRKGHSMERILIVEDDGALRTDMAQEVADWGYDVRVASSALQGLMLIESWRPHLVLSDISMPTLSGFDLRRGVRSLGSGYTDMAFIFVTSLSVRNNEALFDEAAADDCVVKPFRYSELKAKVEAELRRKNTSGDNIAGYAKQWLEKKLYG